MQCNANMNFTALDFETANSNRASVCSVGLVRVENGEIVKEIHQLINPRTTFNFYNTVVHGITEFDVRNAPTFDDFYAEMSPYLEDIVVAHNATFDISCLRAEIARYELVPPDFKYLCTLCISKKISGLQCRKLDALARHYGLGEFNHHNALADAKTCARIFEILSERVDVETMKKSFRDEPKQTKKRTIRTPIQQSLFLIKKEEKHEQERRKHTPQNELIFDYSPIDFSKMFVVTGDFGSMSARDIEGLILREGGSVQRRVDTNTDYLVVGNNPQKEWGSGEYGREIDDALNIGRATFITQSHFLREIR